MAGRSVHAAPDTHGLTAAPSAAAAGGVSSKPKVTRTNSRGKRRKAETVKPTPAEVEAAFKMLDQHHNGAVGVRGIMQVRNFQVAA